MKIAQLSGAYVNAGDFLIQDASNALLRRVFPSAEITIYLRNQISEHFSEIDNADVIVFTGGPLIKEDISTTIPLDVCMRFTPPMMLMGVGWYGKDGSLDCNYSYRFTPDTLAFYKKVTNEGGGIGVRDMYSYRTLKKECLDNIYFTGCPAWYNLELIDNVQ